MSDTPAPAATALPEDPFTPLTHEELNAIRTRILNDEEIPEDEFTRALQTLIANRKGDVVASRDAKAKKPSKAKVQVDLGEFLNEPKPAPKP